MAAPTQYEGWTKESLIERIRHLESQIDKAALTAEPGLVPETQAAAPSSAPPIPVAQAESKLNSREKKKLQREQAIHKRKIDTTKWSTRYVAFKLAYLGKRYGGYEHQATSDVPTIESELWRALTISRLITPDDLSIVDFSCCDYSKCGRTDRGVSSFGQVIGLRVRSKRPPPSAVKKPRLEEGAASIEGAGKGVREDVDVMDVEEDGEASPSWDPIKDEFEYCKMLNRLLPDDIRILAWCPLPPPEFSARFSCRERRYRYFFTQPAFSPLPSACLVPGGRNTPKEGWLDIEAMRAAAKQFEGDHDFRNFCKVDPSKQISNYRRIIYEAEIEEVTDARPMLPYLNGAAFSAQGAADGSDASWPKVYSFNVNGSAFLWHQIRHMVAILFMVGQGLEDPSVVTELLDVEKSPRKPMYVMADEVPLVLWDCVFPELDERGNGVSRTDTLDWRYVGDDDLRAKYGVRGVMDVLWEGWRSRMMDEFLSSRLMGLVASQGRDMSQQQAAVAAAEGEKALGGKPRLFWGGDSWTTSGVYVPLMRRTLQPSPEEQNEKYAAKMGYGSSAEMKAAKGYR